MNVNILQPSPGTIKPFHPLKKVRWFWGKGNILARSQFKHGMQAQRKQFYVNAELGEIETSSFSLLTRWCAHRGQASSLPPSATTDETGQLWHPWLSSHIFWIEFSPGRVGEPPGVGERRRNITGNGQDQKSGCKYERVALSAANSELMPFLGWDLKPRCLEIQDWGDTSDDALSFKGCAVLPASNSTPIL